MMVPMHAQMQFSLDMTIVMRLAEHALHCVDIYVAYDSNAEVASYAADLLLDLHPREIISMVASRQPARRSERLHGALTSTTHHGLCR